MEHPDHTGERAREVAARLSTAPSLADFLEELAAILTGAALAARSLDLGADDLPPILRTVDVARIEGLSRSSVWRKAKLGHLPPPISGPGEPMRWERGQYLEHRRRGKAA